MDKDPLSYFSSNEAIFDPWSFSKTISKIDNEKNYFENAVCIQGNKFMAVCTEQKCHENAIICADLKCKCRSLHEIGESVCRTSDPNMIIRAMSKKIYNMPKAIQELDGIVLKLIDRLSEIQNEIKVNILDFNISAKENELIELLDREEFKDLKGEMFAKVLKAIKIGKRFLLEKKAEQQKMINVWQQKSKQINKIIDSLAVKKPLEPTIMQKDVKNLEGSNIIKSQEEVMTLIEFLPKDKELKQFKKLFTATENNFSIKEFHKKCYNIPHTLIIALTEYDKIIGGYAVREWKYTGGARYQEDKTRQSFVFSLTNKDKFTMAGKGRIQNCWNRIYFCGDNGYSDFSILPNANTEMNNYSLTGNGYENPNYKKGDSESHKKFTGSTIERCRMKEWQVYQVIYKQ